MARWVVAAAVGALVALAGCLGAGGAAEDDEARTSRGGDGAIDEMDFTPLDTLRLDFPRGPDGPLPPPRTVEVPGNQSALRIRTHFSSELPVVMWGSHWSLLSYDPPTVHFAWAGDPSAIVEHRVTLLCCGAPGPATQSEATQVPLDGQAAALEVRVTGWGHIQATVSLDTGVPG